MINVYLAADTGPSGFGVASKGVIQHLLQFDDIQLNVRSHQWGWNEKGIEFQDQNISYGDTRFREYLVRNDLVNDSYMINSSDEMSDRSVNIMKNLNAYRNNQLMIHQWNGEPSDADVWIAIGGSNFGVQAPEEPYTIISTDYNLDIVPRIWYHQLKYVDEIWVPSEWTRQSILNRVPEWNNKVYAFPYGIDMNYKAGKYDHECCINNAHQNPSTPYPDQQCLVDGKFNFLIISRFYHIKGLYRTIKAFLGEFSGNEDVRLFVKTTSNNQFNFNPLQATQSICVELGLGQLIQQQTPQGTVQQFQETGNVPEVGIRAMSLDTQHLYDLLGLADCFLQVSRAECFGIAQFQAAYCGTPVIATNWSAQEELIDGADGFKMVDEYREEHPEKESNHFAFEMGDTYPDDSNWAVPDVYEISRLMRKVYEMSNQDRNILGQQGKEYVESEYQWKDRIQPRADRIRSVA